MAVFWIGERRYKSKQAAGDAVRAVLHGHPVGTALSGDEFDLIRDLLDMHPNAEEKIGTGVSGIQIAPPQQGPYPGFEAIRTDGSVIDFSYLSCLTKPSLRSHVHNVMRAEVSDLVSDYFEARYAAGTFHSDESGAPLDRGDTAVSYFRGPAFAQIADEFAEIEGGWGDITVTSSTSYGLGRFTDPDQLARWRFHWKAKAVLGLLTQAENRKRPRR